MNDHSFHGRELIVTIRVHATSAPVDGMDPVFFEIDSAGESADGATESVFRIGSLLGFR